MLFDNTIEYTNHYHCHEFPTSESVREFHFLREKLSSKVEFSYHEHELYELYFQLSGNIKFYVEGKDFYLKSGDVIAVRPGEIHKLLVEDKNDFEMVIILVNKSFIDEMQQNHPNIHKFFEIVSEKQSIYLHPESELAENIKSTLSKIERTVNSNTPKAALLKNDHFIELIFSINSIIEGSSNSSSVIKPNEKVKKVIDYINSNISKDLSLDMLSDMFFISKYHLSREFSKYTGYTLHQYVLQTRLNKAKKLIDDGFALDEVYSKCGFDDYTTFLNAFKKKYGITPKKYSLKHLEDKPCES